MQIGLSVQSVTEIDAQLMGDAACIQQFVGMVTAELHDVETEQIR